MKRKLILTFMISLYACTSQAGVGKLLIEIIEPIAKKYSKTIDDVPLNTPQAAVATSEASRPAIKYLVRNKLSSNRNSVEYKIGNIIINDYEVCNSFDLRKHINFYKSSVHKESPIRDILLDDENLSYIQRYKVICQIEDIKYLGNGESVDEVSEYAYVETTGSITVAGLMAITYKSLDTFKLEGDVWKTWDAVLIKTDAKLLNEDWWFYDRVEQQCLLNATEDNNYIPPLVLLEEFDQLDCFTKGVENEKLVISCEGEDLSAGSNYVYSATKNACEKLGESIRRFHDNSP